MEMSYLLVIRKCLSLLLDYAAGVGKKAFLMTADREMLGNDSDISAVR